MFQAESKYENPRGEQAGSTTGTGKGTGWPKQSRPGRWPCVANDLGPRVQFLLLLGGFGARGPLEGIRTNRMPFCCLSAVSDH